MAPNYPRAIDWPKLLKAACALGITPDIFWQMTPAETILFISSRSGRLQRELISQAYLTARLIRAKRFPTLNHLLGHPAARPLKGKELERRREEFKTMTRNLDLSKVKLN